MAMLLEREEEMKRRGEDSSTEKWPWTVRETWAAERCLCDAPLSWRGYDSIRYDTETPAWVGPLASGVPFGAVHVSL